MGQTAFLFAPCLSLYAALNNPAAVSGVDVAAATVCFAAILLETVADLQMNNFVASKREKRTDKVMIDSGLWRWSRHPNYCGEISFWTVFGVRMCVLQ